MTFFAASRAFQRRQCPAPRSMPRARSLPLLHHRLEAPSRHYLDRRPHHFRASQARQLQIY